MKILITNAKFVATVLSILLPTVCVAADNPHWNKEGCTACHTEAVPVDGAISLNSPDAEALCETCHGDRGDALPCRHASGLDVGNVAIAESLRGSLKDGQVVCSTCHDLVFQCERPKAHFSLQNPGFLRDRTSRMTSDYCLKCHDSSDFEKLNPHSGITGESPRPTCMLCHASIPETNAAGQLIVEFNMEHDLNDMCQGCHVVTPHPKAMSFGASRSTEEWAHFVAPSEDVLKKMRNSQDETGVELPLSPQNGEILCATCHNPHDFKVGGEHGSEESGMKHRLRQHNICQACHEK
jgi:nitrate/TMAO reductase-like tetraheme cytochrome c subunit